MIGGSRELDMMKTEVGGVVLNHTYGDEHFHKHLTIDFNGPYLGLNDLMEIGVMINDFLEKRERQR
jgi:hypothetical protein